MATAIASATKHWTLADQEAGYELGVDGYMTVAEVCAFMKLSDWTVRRMCSERVLRSVKHGDAKQAPVRICRRSVIEHAKRLEV